MTSCWRRSGRRRWNPGPAVTEGLELSIDTASQLASIALTREGTPLAELTWRIDRDHSKQLLPAVESLLERQGVSRHDLTAIFVCTGPGGYAGVRVGVSTAKGLAFALERPLAGVGRLEIEAYAHAGAGGPVVAVHAAGRAELAWAAYAAGPNWHEMSPPQLAGAAAVVAALPEGALVTGDVNAELAAVLSERGHRIVRGAAAVRRASLLGELGWARLQAGRPDDPKSLVPLYLREPAIGPQ